MYNNIYFRRSEWTNEYPSKKLKGKDMPADTEDDFEMSAQTASLVEAIRDNLPQMTIAQILWWKRYPRKLKKLLATLGEG